MTGIIEATRSRYEVVRRLGVGGMAEVFLAREPAADRLVAVKRLLAADDADRLDLFLDEARIAARFVHPNIVRVHELGCDQDGLYLALEYVAGRSLGAVLSRARRGPPLPRHLAVWIVAEVARGLDHVHRAADDTGGPLGVVHRDLSPPNVLISRDGEVKITDFGIAKARDAEHRTGAGVVRGTAGYMSPEQLDRRPVDDRSDVWSAGVLLWETTLGRRLFGACDGLDAQTRILAAIVPPPSSIDPDYPPELEDALLAALDLDPERRPRAGELEARLRAYLVRIGEPPCQRELAAAMSAWFCDSTGWSVTTGDPAPPPPTCSTRRLGAAPGAHRRRGLIVAGLVAALLGGLALAARPAPAAPRRPELASAWAAAQRGGHEQAALMLDGILVEDPGDPNAATLAVLVHWWLGSRQIDLRLDRVEELPLAAPRRALMRVIGQLHRGRPDDAVAIARLAEARDPGTAEIAYALGEALWHAGEREAGSGWLATAVHRDPAWSMALHHAIDRWTASGDVVAIRDAASALAGTDAAAAADLEVTARIAERRYPDARDTARRATARFPWDAALWQRRAAAELLAGDLEAATGAAQRALRLWPIDERDRGPTAQAAELHLYRGDEAGFERAIGHHFSFANVARLAFWHDARALPAPGITRPAHGLRQYGESAMAAPPLFECASLLAAHQRGDDAAAYWSTSTYPEVRAYGAALADQAAGDLVAAAAHFAEARDAAAGETRLLFAYHLARVERARGDAAAVAAACDEVLRPQVTVTYRAVLARDCAAWTTP